MSSIPAKDVIYIDVDDEITTIIDKVRNSPSKIVALVLPKRATMLQSIVNMKLLKKSADDDKKHLVLITAETGLLPLAAATELYVAKNLQSKPEIPTAAAAPNLPTDIDEEAALALDEEPNLDANKPVGDLANRAGVVGGAGRTFAPASAAKNAGKTPLGAGEDTIDMGDMPDTPGTAAAAGAMVNGKPAKPKKDKNRKVPNFNKFRLWLVIGAGGLALLILLFIVAFKVLPSASVLVKTNSQAVDASVNLALASSGTTLDTSRALVPSQTQKVAKTLTQQAPATGQQNNGNKASGNITIVNCSGAAVNLPAGTGFSSSGKTFISGAAVSIPDSNYSKTGDCKKDGNATISVTAQNGGASYNIEAANYSIAGGVANVTATGSAMSGGTDNITKIVQQSDIDNAKSKLESQDSSSVKTQLQNQLSGAGYMPITATFSTGSPAVTSSAKAGDAAENVTVTEVINYTMVGAKQTDLQKVIASAIKDKIDTSKQGIIDYGLDGATYGTPSVSGSTTNIGMQTSVVVGPDINTEQLVKQIAGKKSGDVKSIIKSTPGVTDVTIHYSPFWVSSMPSNPNKITITIDKPQNSKK